jgi:uncharacterized membrane protein YhaH (DUF805 family)
LRFVLAVLDAFEQYATFAGRTRRADYWCFALFAGVIYTFAARFDSATTTSVFEVFAILGLGLPTLAVLTRRAHDTGRSGWWVLFGLIPIAGTLVLLLLTLLPSQREPNAYGPVPLRASDPWRRFQ